MRSLPEYVEAVASSSGLPHTLVSQLLPLLGELQQLVTLRGQDETDLANELLEASHAVPGVPEKLEPETNAVLVRLLKARRVFIANKAALLQVSRQLLFRDAEVITDLTPVFEASVGEGPEGFTIRHMFRITASSPDGEHKTFEIALDVTDIDTLRETLDRATAKHDALAELLRNKGMPCIN